jgi:energy-converting hydrogenase Eha subunit G
MPTSSMLYNGVLAFLTTLGTSFLAVAVSIQSDGGGLSSISGIQWAIMFVGAFVTFTTQRGGYKSEPPKG